MEKINVMKDLDFFNNQKISEEKKKEAVKLLQEKIVKDGWNKEAIITTLETLKDCVEFCDEEEGQNEHIKFMFSFLDYFIKNLKENEVSFY